MGRTHRLVGPVLVLAISLVCGRAAAEGCCVVIKTGDKDTAGTNADVQVKLIGTKGQTDWLILNAVGDDRERGYLNVYQLSKIADVGELQTVQIRAREENKKSSSPDWYLERLSVYLGDVPANVKKLMPAARIKDKGTRQKALQKFEDELAKLPMTKVFKCEKWIEPGKYSERGKSMEWTVVELK